jgi:hypothetical protein
MSTPTIKAFLGTQTKNPTNEKTETPDPRTKVGEKRNGEIA